MRDPSHVVVLATDFRPMTGGIAESLHHVAHHLVRRVPVTVMTTVQIGRQSTQSSQGPQSLNFSARSRGSALNVGHPEWDHAYRLVALPPLPDRRLGGRIGDDVPPIRKLNTGTYFLRLRRHARRTANQIAAAGDRPAVVVGSWDTASHFWCEACHQREIPYSIVVHGAEVLLPLYGSLPEWRREDFARADHVLANSRATAALAQERLALGTSPVVLNVSPGARPCDEQVAARSTAIRRELELSNGPVILSLGRLIRRKGFDLVLRAVGDLSTQFPRLSYVIAGDGPERPALEALARDLGIAARVRILGEVDDLTKWALYEASDAFAMPNRSLGGSDWEGFGLVFVEAALSRRPSVGGRAGGTADAIVNEVTGLLVDPESRDELTAALRRLLGDSELRQRLGRAGEAMAQSRFSGDVVADRLWDVLR